MSALQSATPRKTNIPSFDSQAFGASRFGTQVFANLVFGNSVSGADVPVRLQRSREACPVRLFRAMATVLAFCLLLSAAAMFAQFESATLTGVVGDASGHVIPNVPVKAINEGTSVETLATTNAEGRYNFPNLRPGSYRVVAATSGFKQFVSSGVVLQVNQAARLVKQAYRAADGVALCEETKKYL